MFNPQTRWDRKLPCQKGNEYGVPIAVTCVMEKGKIFPKSFLWKNRNFAITNINFFWKDFRGKEELVCYSVQTPCGHYQLVLCRDSSIWYLSGLLGP